VHVAYGRVSVLLRQGDEILRLKGSFGGFFPIDNALPIIGRDVGVGLHTVSEVSHLQIALF